MVPSSRRVLVHTFRSPNGDPELVCVISSARRDDGHFPVPFSWLDGTGNPSTDFEEFIDESSESVDESSESVDGFSESVHRSAFTTSLIVRTVATLSSCTNDKCSNCTNDTLIVRTVATLIGLNPHGSLRLWTDLSDSDRILRDPWAEFGNRQGSEPDPQIPYRIPTPPGGTPGSLPDFRIGYRSRKRTFGADRQIRLRIYRNPPADLRNPSADPTRSVGGSAFPSADFTSVQ